MLDLYIIHPDLCVLDAVLKQRVGVIPFPIPISEHSRLSQTAFTRGTNPAKSFLAQAGEDNL